MTNEFQSLKLRFETHWREAILDAPGGQRVDDLRDVVANDAKPRVRGVGLNDPTEGCLRVDRHRVRLIKDDDLDGWDVVLRVLRDLTLSELLDLVPDDLDATLVRGVELQDPMLVESLAEHLFGEGENCRGFARSWRSIHENMRDMAILNGLTETLDDFDLVRYLINL